MTAAPPPLKDSFTSTGSKLFWHQEAMSKLRDGKGMPIVTHIMPTDVCNAKCAFCSVGERPGDVMPFAWIEGYLDQLCQFGLKAVIISGGGNPILYKDKESGKDFNDLVDHIHARGLEIGLITNGMPLKNYTTDGKGGFEFKEFLPGEKLGNRKSWKTVHPETLDKLTWCRISMAGLDANHAEQQVFVPDFDQTKTSLGFSWIMSDSYREPSHKHGWVSTPEDIKWSEAELELRKISHWERDRVFATDRLPWIEEQIRGYVEKHNPAYVRLLANCLQPNLIPERHRMLTEMAYRINPEVVFSQNKPPRQPNKPCAKIFPHPVLNCDGWVFPCDSTVLQRTAGHKFGSAWRVCRWNEIGELYSNPIRQVIPNNICPQCVFADQVDMIGEIIEGMETPVPLQEPVHSSFV